VKHAACHWLVNFALRLAILAEPARPWQIVSSQAHSTVWDGQSTLFDCNCGPSWLPPLVPAEHPAAGHPHRAVPVRTAIWLPLFTARQAASRRVGQALGLFLSDDLTTQVGTLALVPQVVKAVQVPVIAAGGIAAPVGVRAAPAPGRPTCPAPSHSQRHASHRVNRLIREVGPVSGAAPAFPLAAPAVAPLRGRVECQGSGDFSPLWAGQNASGCREVWRCCGGLYASGAALSGPWPARWGLAWAGGRGRIRDTGGGLFSFVRGKKPGILLTEGKRSLFRTLLPRGPLLVPPAREKRGLPTWACWDPGWHHVQKAFLSEPAAGVLA
jgi:hypothetical protein